jgi:PKD repeat protein
VGGTYRDYFDHPLQATATAQDYLEPAPNAATFDPKFTYIDLETTFTARALGLEPLTYNWEFGDGGSTESGNPVIHTFTVTGTVPVTLTVTNDYDTYVAVRPVFVIDPDTQLPTVYLPMLFRNAP